MVLVQPRLSQIPMIPLGPHYRSFMSFMDKASIDDTLSCVDNMFLFLVYSVLTDKMDPLNWGPLALFSIRMGPR